MSQSVQSFLILLFIHLLSIQAYAQVTTWTGNTSNDWNVAANWDNGVPTATYDVIIPSAALQPDINSNVTIQSLITQVGSSLDIVGGSLTVSTTSSNQGTISLNAGNWVNQGNLQNTGTIQIGINRTLRVTADLINDGAISAANPSLIELNNTGTQTISGSGISNFNQLIKVQGVLNIEKDISIARSLNIPASLTLNLAATRNLTLSQDLSILGTLDASNATLTLQGINTQTLTSSTPLNALQLVLDKTSGIVNLDTDLNLTQDFNIPAGVEAILFASRTLSLANQLIINGIFTNSATNNTINFTGTSAITLSSGILDFQNLQISKTGAGSLTIAQNTTVNANVLVSSGTLNLNTGFTLDLAGDFTNNGNAFIASTGSIINLIDTNNQTLGGTAQVQFDQLQINKTAGVISMTSNLSEIKENLVVPLGVTLNIAAGQNLILSQDLSILGTLDASNATLTLQGTNNQTLTSSTPLNALQLVLDKTSGIVNLDANLNLTQDFTIPAGVEAILFASRTLSLANQLIINGIFTNSANDNTINFTGTSAITLSSGILDFQNLQISKTGAGSLTIAQNTTVNANVLVSSGTLNLNTGFTLDLAGNFTNNGNAFIANTGSIINLIGTNNQTLGGTAQVQFETLQVSKTTGTLFIDRNPIEVIQDFTVPAGVSFRINPGDNFDVYNDFINEGTVLPNDGGVRFRGAGNAELRGNGIMTFRDVMSRKTGGGTLTVKVPINVASWLIIDANAQLVLEADITVGAAGGIARIQNNGTFVDNGFKVIVEGTGNYSIQGNTQTIFSNIEITKNSGGLIFEQSATVLQDLIVPANVTLTVNANLDLRLERDLIVNGSIDPSQIASEIWFTGNTDSQITGTANPATFNNIRLAKTGGNTLNLNINTQYANQIYIEANNTLRLNDGLTTLVQNDSDTFVYGTVSLGNNTAMNYDNGNAEMSIESTGLLINDVNSINTVQARIRVRNGGGTVTVSNGSTLTAEGRIFNVEWNIATLNLSPNATLVMYQDLQLNNDAVLNIDNTAFIEFAGNQNSDIEGGGTQLDIPNLRINKTGSQVSLRRDVMVTNYLDLVNHHIISTDNDPFIFAEGATHSGGSAASYINGPARKIGNTDFIFPLGNNNRLGKIGIVVNTAGANTDIFEAEYFGTFFGNTSITAPISDVSDRDFWQLERTGTTQVKVALYWQDEITGGIGPNAVTRSDLQTAQWNEVSMSWETRGNTTATIVDFIESDANQDNFAADKFWSLAYRNGDNTNWGAGTWIGSVSTDWDDPNNWQPNVVPDETITAVIIGDRLLEGKFNPIKNTGGVAKAKALLIPRVIFPTGLPTTQKGFLTIANGFTLEVGDGSVGSGLLECYGDILNQGTITNTADFYLYEDAIFNNQGSLSVGNDAFMYSSSELNINNSSIVNIDRHLRTYDDAQVNNEGIIQTGRDIDLRNSSIINNLNTGEITVGHRLYLRDASALTNDNILNVNRQADIQNNAILTNNASINTGIEVGQAGTFTMNNNAQLNNSSGASITLTQDPASSFFLNNSVTVNNDGTLTSGRQFELRGGGVTVTNNGLIQWRQDFRNDGTFTGTGTIEVYGNHNNTRIYGSSTPFITHNFIMNRTGGRVTQERSCIWTSSVTVPSNVTYEIQTGLYNTEVQGDFTINGAFDLQGDASIAISEDFINNGTVTTGIGSTVTMQGNINASIQSTSPLTLHHLVNQKATGSVQVSPEITLNGDLSNLSGTLELLVSSSVDLKGNLVNDDVLIINPGVPFNFSGNTDSEISGTQVTTFAQLSINKNAGNQVTLQQSTEVNESLTLTSGIVNTTATNFLTLQENATSTEGNPQSYISGPIRKYVNGDDFVFPTGKNGRWARIAITDLANTTPGDYFTANYIPFTYPDNTVIDLDRRSSLEYWTLDRSTAGTTEARVTLYWEDATFSDINDVSIQDLRVAQYTNTPSTGWYDRGGVLGGSLAQGTVMTANRQTSFSPWTFGSLTGVNSLPIRLISFEAKATPNQQVAVRWSTATEENVSHFEIQRSQDGQNFQTLLTKDAAGNSNTRQDYEAIDAQPLNGISYYRLKSVDNDGSTSYSLVETVRFEEEEFEITNLYPNPVLRETTLEMTLPENAQYQIILYDVQGKQVYLGDVQKASEIFTQRRLDLENLKAGTYILKVVTNQKSITRKVVKVD